jgi:LPS O-antigen subunit length determinant protein (WzzB/FepE family)
VSGEVGLRQLIVAPQLKVKFKAGDAIESKDVLSEAIASFFGYANERFDEIKQPVFLEYNETLRLAELDYNTSMKNIDYEIAQRNLAIESLEKDAAEMEERIKSIESGELSTESLSKATLLRTILSDLEGRLNNEKNSKIFLERSKMEERVSYERSVKNAKVSFDAQMAVVREFKVVSSPQVPKSYVYPKVALNLELSVIAGLLFSCVFVLVRHGRGK